MALWGRPDGFTGGPDSFSPNTDVTVGAVAGSVTVAGAVYKTAPFGVGAVCGSVSVAGEIGKLSLRPQITMTYYAQTAVTTYYSAPQSVTFYPR